MRSGDTDVTARATIRDCALRLFAEHGPDAVTIRQIAAAAGVSPALVLHHFGSKAGLRTAVDDHVIGAFDTVTESLDEATLGEAAAGGSTASLAGAFAEGFPPDSPLPAYLRRLLLSGDPAGQRLFQRWYAMGRDLLRAWDAAGVTIPAEDPDVRAAFLMCNDLALVLLRDHIERAIGTDPLSEEGMRRWVAEAMAVYGGRAFRIPPSDKSPAPEAPGGPEAPGSPETPGGRGRSGPHGEGNTTR